MTWIEALRYLFSLEQRGIKLDLARMRSCLEDLGRPQDAFGSILVAGTNGKGSTAAALSSALSRPSRRVGLYTSPHLLDYRERIRLDGRLAPKAVLLSLLERDRPIWERHELSFFESTTALAFAFFREAGVELAVLEVGLGGRLDATNTVEPILSVITPLGMDHAHLLGDTAAAIAREKAGILRPDVPAAVAGGPPEAIRAVAERARDLGAPLYLRRESVWVSGITEDGGTRFRIRPRRGALPGFSLPPGGLEISTRLAGRHQVANASLAVLALALLRQRGLSVLDAEIAGGIARVSWPGRLERPVAGLPLIADVAHNREGARVLARALAPLARRHSILPIVGMVAHKDHAGFFVELRSICPDVWVAPLAAEKGAPRSDLESAAAGAGLRVHVAESVAAALQELLPRATAPGGPWVLLCGSFHTLEEGYLHLGVPPLESLW